jgi:hypothetical protein
MPIIKSIDQWGTENRGISEPLKEASRV